MQKGKRLVELPWVSFKEVFYIWYYYSTEFLG